MPHSNLILTLTGGLTAALLLGYITHRLGLSPIVGYLLAGFVVGPHTPGFTADRALAEQLAEIGVVLLMFGVGLHFHPKDLLAVKKVATVGAIGQSALATACGALIGHLFLWTWPASIVFGLALSVASTVVLTRVLADNGDLQTRVGRISVGWLVVEDVFTVLILVMLPALFGGGGGSLSWSLLAAIAKLAVLVAFTFLVAGRLIPRILGSVARTRSRELFTLTVLVLALGIAVMAANGFGTSMALGSFLAGMVVGRSEFGLRAASEAMPMRDAFAVLFFVSVGMLFDPGQLMQRPVLALSTLGIVLLVKPIAAFVIVSLLGLGSRTGLGVAVSLAQVGEFSFLLAGVAKPLGVFPDGATEALVTAAIVSISLNPLYYRLVRPMEQLLRSRQWLWRSLNRASQVPEAPDKVWGPSKSHQPRAVVVGYGPIGAMVTRLLSEREILPTVIELNLETFRKLREMGIEAIYGDANQSETLEQAGVAQADSLILTAPGDPDTPEMIRIARSLNPGIRVLARSSYLDESGKMQLAGADRVFSGEGEVALAICEYILQQLGATNEQMDMEREEIRTNMFPPAGEMS